LNCPSTIDHIEVDVKIKGIEKVKVGELVVS
jgi:hypothetical protein